MRSTKHVHSTGDIIWKNDVGEWHREDGPAVEYVDGSVSYYLNDVFYTELEYKQEMVKINLKKLKV